MRMASGMTDVKIATIQMCSISDKFTNLMKCESQVKTAAENGARLVCLPECCLYIGGGLFSSTPSSSSGVAPSSVVAESVDGPSMLAFKSMAKKFGVWLSVGSFPERNLDEAGKGFNLQVIVSPDGELTHKYRKIHLFDSPYSGLQESKTTGIISWLLDISNKIQLEFFTPMNSSWRCSSCC